MLMGLKTEDDYEQIQVDAMMDSGAYDTVCGTELIGGNEIKETEMAKAGMCYSYSGPNESEIKNKGETTLEGESSEGHKMRFTTQVGEGMNRC